jgi:glycosyltransferase involved in cell wall biosynthesis
VYPPYRGGIGHVAFEYVERLRARGHDAHAFTLSHGHAYAIDPAYVHRLPSLRFGNAGFAPALLKALDGFDLVHLHYPFFGGAEFVLMHQRAHPRMPLVVTYHMDAAAEDWRRFVFRGYRETLMPFVMRAAKRIFVSSNDYASASELAAGKGIDDKLAELPFGVDTERFRPDGAFRNEPTLLFVGGLDAAHHFKGLDVLLEALRPLAGTPWNLVVVGDGDLRATYEAKAESLGLSRRVRFVGAATDADLPALYRDADLLLFPSTSRAEAFGLVLLEAAASGLASIASDLPGVRTVVEHGRTGLLTPPRDVSALSRAIERLLKNPEERRSMGAAARDRAVSRYAWDPLMDRLETEYRSLL